jgi:hypothetical protein
VNKAERIEYVCTRLRAGDTLQKIGDALGLTRERVRQIATDFGVKRVPQPKPAKIKPPRKVRPLVFGEIRAACAARGLPDPYLAFLQHRSSAQGRGIDFRFSFEEWWGIWEPHYERRGNRLGCVVMCRTLDAGAYEVGNVAIKTIKENRQEQELARRLKSSMWKRKGPSMSSYDPLRHHDREAECGPL